MEKEYKNNSGTKASLRKRWKIGEKTILLEDKVYNKIDGNYKPLKELRVTSKFM